MKKKKRIWCVKASTPVDAAAAIGAEHKNASLGTDELPTKSAGARRRQAKPPTSTGPHGEAEKSGGQTAVRRGHYVLLLFPFLSPLQKNPPSSLIFVPRVLQIEHKSRVECVGEPQLIVCSALSDPQPRHECMWTHTRTHSLSSTSPSVIKRRAVAGSNESARLFSTSLSHAGQSTDVSCATRWQSGWGHR